ncbi:short-chain fatty acid transporter [Psychroflexus aestuariivivens]|uniref:short-chain fatty acid transporter n=1 Tax=Psychroflexus aestuariivivens TaxID=1795040 RepID=UPI001F015CED|nr:TIGR00366 family protein [Psychroflexus aestuariivivens]
MKLISKIESFFAKFLPSPFTLSIILSIISLILAYLFGDFDSDQSQIFSVFKAWQNGIWNSDLLVFGYQMMLILVLGHILVLSQPVNIVLKKITSFVSDTKSAVVLVTVATMLMGFFNWGLGLIFGAILVRKIGEKSANENLNINYPLVGALGYSGMMIWHGGLSGSAPLKVAEKGHLKNMMGENSNIFPDYISTSDTIFSIENLIIFGIVLVAVPIIFRKIQHYSKLNFRVNILIDKTSDQTDSDHKHPLEQHRIVSLVFGSLLLIAFFISYFENIKSLNLTPNMLNFFMLGLGVLLHKNIFKYLKALSEAIKGASGILIQFPLYFGIIGLMKDSGLAINFANFFVSISNETTLPIFTFISSGIVNIFVPSGGGQWAIQGPIAIDSASKLGVPLPKIVMALSYGDQITNMLQPFWALPLLAITKLKASDIFPFTFILFIIGSIIYILGLLFIF